MKISSKHERGNSLKLCMVSNIEWNTSMEPERHMQILEGQKDPW